MFGLPSTTLVPAALIFLAVAFGTLSLALLVDILQERSRRRDAMRQLRSFTNQQVEGPGLLRGLDGQVPDWLVPVASRVPALEDARLMLEQAGSKISLARFLVISLGLSLGLGLGILVLTLNWIPGIGAAAFGAALPYLVFRSKRTRRFYKFEEQLPRGHRHARARHPCRPPLVLRAQDGGRRSHRTGRERVPPHP
jgi:Flp pilus assembly protein TadB